MTKNERLQTLMNISYGSISVAESEMKQKKTHCKVIKILIVLLYLYYIDGIPI